MKIGQESPGDVKMTIDRETKTPRWANQEPHDATVGTKENWEGSDCVRSVRASKGL